MEDQKWISTKNVTYNLTLQSNTSFEITGNLIYDLPVIFKIVMIILYMITFCVSLIGNFTLCYIIKQLPLRSNRRVNYFLISSASNDILITLTCIPVTVTTSVFIYWWPFGSAMCTSVQFFQLVCVLHKSFNIVVVIYDQYMSVSKPLSWKLSKRAILAIILFSWISSILFATPTSVFSTIVYLPSEPGSRGLCVVVFPDVHSQHINNNVIMILQYCVPLVVMIWLHFHIGYIIWTNKIPGEVDLSRDTRRERSKRRSVQILAAMVVVFLCTWMPLHVLTLVGESNPSIYNEKTIHILWITFHWLGLSNSATNCIFYYLKSNTIKFHLKKIMCNVMCLILYKDIDNVDWYKIRHISIRSAQGDNLNLMHTRRQSMSDQHMETVDNTSTHGDNQNISTHEMSASYEHNETLNIRSTHGVSTISSTHGGMSTPDKQERKSTYDPDLETVNNTYHRETVKKGDCQKLI